MIRGLVDRSRSSGLLQGSAWIVVGLAIQAILGFVFWLLGARVASSTELGEATALYTAIQFVNYASGLGLTIALARHATLQNRESDALFGWAVVATFVSSVVFGSVYLALVDTSATRLVNGSAGSWALFCVFTAGTSVSLLIDVRLMAARRWAWMVGRIAVAALIRLPFVQLDVGVEPAVWLYWLMLAPLAGVGFSSIPLLRRMGGGGIGFHRPRTLRMVSRYAGVNWFATLSSQAPQFVLPLVVAQSVAPSINASFFLAWTVTSIVFLLPAAIAQVLLVEGGKDAQVTEATSTAGSERAREALVFSVGLATLAWIGSLVVGPAIAAVFGSEYDRLARLLPGLMLAGIPWGLTSIRLSEARIRKDQAATVAITATLGITILVPTLLWVPSGGASAAAVTFVAGNIAGAIVAMAMHERWRRSSRMSLVVT
ncbi:lipopolysaccharide biosynthesis protein [Aquihabitans daechungensis]|uniref:lipopolysaccharide biosynthesis protein n=1 Tax=Aquihabitans daechungensis TaxID=1052257 RepID=UPI003B9E9438